MSLVLRAVVSAGACEAAHIQACAGEDARCSRLRGARQQSTRKRRCTEILSELMDSQRLLAQMTQAELLKKHNCSGLAGQNQQHVGDGRSVRNSKGLNQ